MSENKVNFTIPTIPVNFQADGRLQIFEMSLKCVPKVIFEMLRCMYLMFHFILLFFFLLELFSGYFLC